MAPPLEEPTVSTALCPVLMPERRGLQHVDRMADVLDADGFHQLGVRCLHLPGMHGSAALPRNPQVERWVSIHAWMDSITESSTCAVSSPSPEFKR